MPSDEASPLEMSSILNDRELVGRLDAEGFEYHNEDGDIYANNLEFLPAWLIGRFLQPPPEVGGSYDGLEERSR